MPSQRPWPPLASSSSPPEAQSAGGNAGANGETAMLTAREAAKDLLRVYVLRGETVEQLAGSMMGRSGPEYRAHIGGSICPDDISLDIPGDYRRCRKITARQVAARVPGGAWAVFSLEQIHAEILDEAAGVPIQAALL
jgi:hypothetical protein